MKYPIAAYAKALAQALQEKPADVSGIAQRFMRLLARTGDRSALGRIVEAAENMLLARRGGRKVVIESARPLVQDDTHRLKQSFEKEDAVEFRVKPELIAGVRIRIGEDSMVDASLAGRLNRLTARLRNIAA